MDMGDSMILIEIEDDATGGKTLATATYAMVAHRELKKRGFTFAFKGNPHEYPDERLLWVQMIDGKEISAMTIDFPHYNDVGQLPEDFAERIRHSRETYRAVQHRKQMEERDE